VQKKPWILLNLKWVYSLLCFAFLCGCKPDLDIANLKIEQDHSIFLNPEITWDVLEQKQFYDRFRASFLSPWKNPISPKNATLIQEEFSFFKSKLGYAENRQKRKESWFNHLLENAHLQDYPNLKRSGIVLTGTTLRHLPTAKPIFNEETDSFFDRLQKTTLYANTPVYVLHQSKDRAWFYIQSCYANGWVDARSVAWVTQDQIDTFSSSDWLAITMDEVLLETPSRYHCMGRIGMVLPKVKENLETFDGMIFDRDLNANAIQLSVSISKKQAQLQPVAFNSRNLKAITNQLSGKPYGWGGQYENRDCSALIKDLMVPFGLFLPRHSEDQAKKTGHYILFSHLKGQKIEEKIIKEGIAYQTVLWFPGHIMLYIGERGGKAYVFHAIWGLKDSPNIIGQSIISSLDLRGITQESLLDRLKGMTILTRAK